ncbi:RBP15 [Trypanosoma brucei gambiense DAL972]|nr:RBP15 [Trypanosoma brucei gambiense DAL972]CBH15824.1 RBP15 [Trypanosoma brucei gambiense DAL972]|eukprot:XP_011778088.1 RBP15 [Trypanosoma brucei gambiense DAL972]
MPLWRIFPLMSQRLNSLILILLVSDFLEGIRERMSDERILLVTGIPTKLCRGEELYKVFGNYGTIQQLRIGSDASTKGCAIVVYELCEAASAALEALHDFKVDRDRHLRVSVYDETRDRRALERRKRRREMKAEYSRNIASASAEVKAED